MKIKLPFKEKCNCIGHFLTVMVIIVMAWYISGNFYQLIMISGNSMLPSYHNMQIVILDKHSEEYGYGDVVAFRCDGLEATLIKRIVACPGDTVIIEDGILYVNETISEVFSEKNVFGYEGIAVKKIYLDEEQYFVIGDNISESKDSRYSEVGCVCIADIIGKIVEHKGESNAF